MNDANEKLKPSALSLRTPFLVALCLVVGMGAGVLYDRLALLAFVPSNAVADFHLMSEAWNTIQRHYVDRAAIKPKALTYGAISGMVEALGDTGHSVFLSPETSKHLSQLERGKFKGVGISVEMKNGRVVVIAPLDDSPAQRARVRAGDIIVSVDGQDVAGWSLNQVIEKIAGPVGTSVELGLLDPQDHRLRKVSIVRETIEIKSVTWERLPGTEVADVRVARFDDGTTDQLKAALRAIHEQSLSGMILDLRNNPGGLLEQAVTVASQFLTNGNVLLVQDADKKITPMPVEPGGLAPKLPMVVLINGGSASAAEIVAGALGDAHRAVLIGKTTFGTGTVINKFPLSDGSALMLAIQEWLTPSGHSFWHKGIKPELEVSLPPGVNPLVPAAERNLTPAELQSSDDQQLLRALEKVQENIQDRTVSGSGG